MNAPLCVVSAGARTPAGLDAASSAAAVRAGVPALAQHAFLVDATGERMTAGVDAELDPALMGPGRLLKLAEAALREAWKPPASARPRLKVCLGLPEPRPGFSEPDGEAVRAGLAGLKDLAIEAADVHVFLHGHAAGFSALAAAAGHLGRGEADLCLVGGVDSYHHADTLDWLQDERRLFTAETPSGFVPGEGAAFCMLATEKACSRLGLKPILRLSAIAVGKEPKTFRSSEICLGEGLTSTVREAIQGLRSPSETVQEILCDINGERYRSEEWGFVCLHLGTHFDDPTGYRSPSDFLGDQGAASAPLFAMLACQAVERGYGGRGRTLIWAGSEGGLRGAAVLDGASKA